MSDEVTCPCCDSNDAYALNGRAEQFRCAVCDETFELPRKSATRKKRAQIQDSQRRAKSQERWNARKLGGRTTRASGALEGDKADVTTSKYGEVASGIRMECKSTRKASYSLTLANLRKLQTECEDDEIPVFAVQFVQGDVRQSFYILPEGHALELLEQLDD